MTEPRPQFRKATYRLGEAAEIAGVEGHVLRYWETEFPMLQPRKSPGGQRLYAAADVETALRIRDLLYRDGFTIAGARRQLETDANAAGAEAEDPVGRCLREVYDELEAILTVLEADETL